MSSAAVTDVSQTSSHTDLDHKPHARVCPAAAAQLERLFVRVGDKGEVIAKRGNVTGTIAAATAEGITMHAEADSDMMLSYFIPFVDIQIFIRDGAGPDDDRVTSPGGRAARRLPPPKSPLKRSGECLCKIKLLGQGAQGQVWQARYQHAPPGEFVVLKEMLFTQQQQKQMQQREAQAKRIMALRHEHLIEYIDVIVEHEPTHMVKVVMPFYKENDMLNFVTNLTKPLSEYALCSLILQVAHALDYLHTLSPPMVHRDVKLENILMFDNCTRTMLMDLDMSREMTKGARPGNVTMCGTYEYMAPEVHRFEGTTKSDVWSLGMVLLVLLTMPDCLTLKHPSNGDDLPLNSPLWQPEDLDTAVVRAVDKLRQRTGHAYSRRVVGLACQMLPHDINTRVSAEDVALELQEIMVQCLTTK